MKIVIIGCGAMGSVYAGLLARAGNDVVVVDRGVAHVAAINRLGLRVEGASGDHIAAIRAFTQVPDAILSSCPSRPRRWQTPHPSWAR